MAIRRMIHQDVICCDAFLDLDFEAQALFFQLQIKADEYGFVQSPRSILRMMGASVESLEALVRNGFVIKFHSGVIVMTHWDKANTRRPDREAKIRFPEEYSLLQVDKTGVYSMRDDSGMTTGTQWDDNGNPSISISPSHSVSPSLNPAKAEAVEGASSSVSESSSSTEGENSDEDTDPEAEEAITYEEFFDRTFPGRFKELLSTWAGFTEISVRDIRAYLSEGVSPELIMWAACHAVDSEAASPRNYLRSVIEDKMEIGCITPSKLLEVEGTDRRERESVLRITKQCSDLREQICAEWNQMRGGCE